MWSRLRSRRAAWFSAEAWARDFRWAARSLRRSPGFSLAVVGSLVVCLGPNTAILAALHALVLRPLPLPEPGQLVAVTNVADRSAGQVLASSLSQYADFRDHADLFAGFAAVRSSSGWLEEGDGPPQRWAVEAVTTDYFATLGVAPLRGRFFNADEGVPGRNQVLVLTQDFWAAHYAADPAVIGRQVRWEGQWCTIIGVAPRAVSALRRQTCLFQPHAPTAARFDPALRYRGDVRVIGRLRTGVARSAGLVQLRGLEETFRATRAPAAIRDYAEQAGFHLQAEVLRVGGVDAGTTRTLWLLQISTGLVLLIGTVNVMNLSLARLSARRGELAVRQALGADRAALWRQGWAESGLLVAVAVVGGAGSAALALHGLNVLLPTLLPGAPAVTLSGPTIAGLLAGAGGLALALSVLPALAAGGREGDWGGGRTATGGRRVRIWRRGLIVSQVALAVVLLVGASLLIRSLRNVRAVDPGFAADQVVAGRITLPRAYWPVAPLADRYTEETAAANVGLQERIVTALGGIPGVARVSQALEPVVDPTLRPVPFELRTGRPDDGDGAPPLIHLAAVAPEFFATLGQRLEAGRDFTAADRFPTRPVAIVDETFGARYLPGRPVVGQEIRLSKGLPLAEAGWVRIVGVVSRAQFTGLDSPDTLPMVFVAMAGFPVKSFEVLVRSPRGAPEVIAEVRTRLRDVDPALSLTGVASLQAELDDQMVGRRGLTLLLGLFAGVALALAAIGLHGVLAYEVTQREREIGIRVAIGATRGHILGLMLGQGAVQIGLGVGLGGGGAVLLSRYLHSLLFGLTATDPIAYAVGIGAIVTLGLLACWWPARRASRVDPLTALRAE